MTDTLTKNLDQITINGNVRTDLHLDDSFVASIKEHGVIQPVIVSTDGVLIAGHRRYAAAEQVGITELPVIIRDIDPEDMRAIQLVENLQRNDLTPLETAQAVWEMKDLDDYTQPMIEEATGMTRTVVSELQKIGKAFAVGELTDERIAEANQLSLPALVALAEVEVPLEEVVRVISDNEFSDSVRSAVTTVENEQASVQFMDDVAEDIQAWSDAGIELTYDDPSVTEEDEYGRVKRDAKFKKLGEFYTKVDIAEHMELDCHITEIHVGGTGWGDRPEVIHWCRHFSIHEAKGKSPLKHDGAADVLKSKETNQAINKSQRDERALRVAQAKAWKPTKGTLREMGIVEAGDYIGYDDAKIIGRDILEFDKPADVKGMDANNWYSKEVKEYIDDNADGVVEQALLRIRLNHQLRHVKGSITSYGWSAAYPLKDIEVPEVTDE
jgi:ParB-like chromosome segregation protein Spo0J